MRIEFAVTASGADWTVRGGHAPAIRFATHASALVAAENMAKVASTRGALAVVTDLVEGRRREVSRYLPESLVRAPQPPRPAGDPPDRLRPSRPGEPSRPPPA